MGEAIDDIVDPEMVPEGVEIPHDSFLCNFK
jgi:hypothetical protein